MSRNGHILEMDAGAVNGEQIQIVIVEGYGRTQRNSYGWIGNSDWTVTTNGVNLTIIAEVVEVRR